LGGSRGTVEWAWRGRPLLGAGAWMNGVGVHRAGLKVAPTAPPGFGCS
jgi:hypothetical protein